MDHKYCDQHELWYDYKEGCPECTKVPKIIGSVLGNIIGGAIYGTVWVGKKIYDKLTEDNNNIDGKLFCPECGRELLDEEKFCMKCGTKIKRN